MATITYLLTYLLTYSLNASQLETIAGVSSGACVAALLAVGCSADEIFTQLVRLGLSDLTIPEIGSLLRLMSALVFTAAKALSLDVLLPASALAAAERIVSSAGPGGLTAGTALEAKVCTYVLTYLLTYTYLLIYLLTSRTALEAKVRTYVRIYVLTYLLTYLLTYTYLYTYSLHALPSRPKVRAVLAAKCSDDGGITYAATTAPNLGP